MEKTKYSIFSWPPNFFSSARQPPILASQINEAQEQLKTLPQVTFEQFLKVQPESSTK